MRWCTFCDVAEAYKAVVHKDGAKTPLCNHCAMLYEMGQASPDAEIVDIEDVNFEEAE
jgi:hypothetical protein